MPEVQLKINGEPLRVREGTSVAAAMLIARAACRMSVAGEPRAALCGMGICFECRAVVDGVAHARTCQMSCREGMAVQTQW